MRANANCFPSSEKSPDPAVVRTLCGHRSWEIMLQVHNLYFKTWITDRWAILQRETSVWPKGNVLAELFL